MKEIKLINSDKAAQAYNVAACILFKDFANLNSVPPASLSIVQNVKELLKCKGLPYE